MKKFQHIYLYAVHKRSQYSPALNDREHILDRHMERFVCEKITQKIKNRVNYKYLSLMLFVPATLFLFSGFIQKLPEQSLSGSLNLGKEQLYPLKNETGKKDNLPGTGTITLNNAIHDIFKGTAKLEQNTARQLPVLEEKPLTSIAYHFPANHISGNPFFVEHIAVTVTPDNTQKLQPHMQADKYHSNTHTSYAKRKKAISPYVNQYAKKFGFCPDFIMSIIQVESNFISHALSKQNAHGLMQVVPEMAAAEVNRIFKHENEISSMELMHPKTNIYYGTAYLYILKKYHLNGVEDPKSMEALLIASYNAGSGAVLRHFGKTKSEAIEAINNMSASEVYKSLTQTYRTAETREYLKRVAANLS